MAGGSTEGVAQCALMSLPSCAVAKTAQMAAAALAASAGTAVCADGCADGTCIDSHPGMFVLAVYLVAMAPAAANPYLNAAIGTTADTGGVAGGAAQHVRGHFTPHSCTEAELMADDPRLQRLTGADRWLLGAYGNIIHQNNDTHLHGRIGVAEDAQWQRPHLRVAACHLQLYNLPNGRWANRFLETLMDLWVRVIERRWNFECPLIFQACVLWRIRGVSRFHDVKPIIWGWLDSWDAECYVALVKGVEEANLEVGGGGGRPRKQHEYTTLTARKYHNMVLCGKVRATVHMVMNRGTGGAYRPFDLDTKSGRPVINMLLEKHPASLVSLREDFDAHADAPNCLESLPVYCFEECVAKAAAHLSGSAGPCGVKADMLKKLATLPWSPVGAPP
jgi:hypothetical protein